MFEIVITSIFCIQHCFSFNLDFDCSLLTYCTHCLGAYLLVKSTRFAKLDDKEMTIAKARKKRRSRNGKIWAVNAFDEWQLCHSLSTKESIGDLLEKEDIRDFINMLKFIL